MSEPTHPDADGKPVEISKAQAVAGWVFVAAASAIILSFAAWVVVQIWESIL